MLEIIEYGKDEYGFPCLLVLGCFDAIHAGHRELLKKAKLQAKINGLDLGVMMFYNGKGGKQVFSFEERLKFLEQFNVKFILKIDFTDEFKKTKPLDFLANLEEKLNVKAYMSGKDFRFGEKAKGKSSTLKNYADDEENGVWYMPVKDVVINGEKVSTTLIKDCLAQGDIAKANELLSVNYFISGEVVNGMGRGSSLGYPTVNINYPTEKTELKQGVYKVKSVIDEVEYEGVANYGARPTFNEEEPVLEVYFEGFEGDLYGKVLTVEFVEYLRDIQKFENAEELSSQLSKDVETISAPETEEVAEVVEEVPAEVVEAVEETPAEENEVVEEVCCCEKCGNEVCECESGEECNCEECDCEEKQDACQKQCSECDCKEVCQCDCEANCEECPCEDDCENCDCDKSCQGCSHECEHAVEYEVAPADDGEEE